MAAVFRELTVAAVDPLCDDAAAITFDVPPEAAADFGFAPGQSLTLRRVVDGVEQRRSYSICAPLGEPLQIGVREIPDGLFSRWLVREVRPGDRVEALPPSGAMRADPEAGGRHLLIAAGSGITPMLSIAASMLANPTAEVALVYGNRTTSSVMFVEELGDLKNRYGPRFQVVHVMSREPREVELFSGRLDADRLRRLLTVLLPVESYDHVWLCGPFALTTTARVVLAELGVAPDRVHVELFYVDEPPPELHRASEAPTGAVTELTVVLDGSVTTAVVGRDRSVLDAAQASRADLPFACKGGVCGTCRAVVREGEVEMRRNYALEEGEVEAGFVLTCQSFPVTDTVTVDFDA